MDDIYPPFPEDWLHELNQEILTVSVIFFFQKKKYIYIYIENISAISDKFYLNCDPYSGL